MKKLFIAFVLLSLSSFLLAAQSHAALDAFSSDCLEATRDGVHSAELSFSSAAKRAEKGIQAPQGGVVTWVVVCIQTNLGNKCTSGDRDIDIELFDKAEDYDSLDKNTSYSPRTIGGVEEGKNPSQTTTDVEPQFTNPPIVWQDEYVPQVKHTWIWVQAAAPVEEGQTGTGDIASQQLGLLAFIKDLADSSKCTKISWDPKGYVFDAKTLYPVRGVGVMLSQKDANGKYIDVPSTIGITNPTTTLPTNGQYSFYVPSGSYKLRLSTPNATIASKEVINPLYNSIFPAVAAWTIYQPDAEIIERGDKVEVSHIPVIITDQSLLVKNLSVIGRSEERVGEGSLLFSGQLSHPMSLIKITTTSIDANGKTYQNVKNEVANGVGDYSFVLPQFEVMGSTTMYLTKYDVSFSLNPSIYSDPGAYSPLNSFSGEVIPTYISGIAYGKDNNPLVNAVVGIYSTFSNTPQYITSTDETGKFSIGSQHIPQFNYGLRYKSETGVVIMVSPAVFVKQNVAYFNKNNINPFSMKTTTKAEEMQAQKHLALVTGGESLKATSMKLGSGIGKGNTSSERSNQLKSDQQKIQETQMSKGDIQGVAMIFVVIIVLLLIGVGAFIMMRSKQTQPPQTY